MTTIKRDGQSERALYKPLAMKRRSPEDQFVENIVSSTRLMKEREGIQRKLLDALARDLLQQGSTLNSLIRSWSNETKEEK